MHDEPPVGGTIEQQAADWLSRRERGFAPEEQEAFSKWLLEDPALFTVGAALRWRHQRFEFTDVPLKEVVRLFNRQNDQKLEVETKAAEIPVSGIYWLDDPEGFSRVIAYSAGLEAVHLPSQSIMLRQP
jgi:ferric-dicitrate binding protein FerR (iron transport regulator)